MIQSEKQLNTKATMDAFDEIYTNFDFSTDGNTYDAQQGYPFDYPTRWLNDPSMNKRIAIRRLDVTPSTHSFRIRIRAEVKETYHETYTDALDQTQTLERNMEWYENTVDVTVTEHDNLNKVLDFITRSFEYELGDEKKKGGLDYDYDNRTNQLVFKFYNSKLEKVNFHILSLTNEPDDLLELYDFLKFLNQSDEDDDAYDMCTTISTVKTFNEVWNRDRLHFHASFSTSRRKFIGKRGDFYQTLTLLYPPPTNESSFYIRFTSNGMKNILLRHCEFDVQLCYIVNYKKSSVL